MMKKVFYFMMVASLMLFAYSCEDDKPEVIKTFTVNVELGYPEGYEPAKDVVVTLTNSTNNKVLVSKTNANGVASFSVVVGVYSVSATDNRTFDGGMAYVLNGVKSDIAVTDTWKETDKILLQLSESKLSQVVIKEFFYGGTPSDDGSRPFSYDKYLVLYNNSAIPAKLDNMCIGHTMAFGPKKSLNRDYVDGKLLYEAENWVPAGVGFWYFPNPVTLEPGKQLVVALNNAVDNTKTYSKSINFANSEYYAAYDIDVFTHKYTYVAPAAEIPTSHHLKAVKYGTGTAFIIYDRGPALFLFTPQNQTVKQFADDASNLNTYGGLASQIRKKVPVDWVVDGVEVFNAEWGDDNGKRLNAVIDAGAVNGLKGLGYSIYRNVDKAATEAIKENEGKLVYNYAFGTADIEKGTTDPSGIDAEASMKNGARIVYKDTNNSTDDFHMRKQASLRN